MNTLEHDSSSNKSTATDSSIRSMLLDLFVLALLAITVLRPLDSTEFWWQAARGGAVLNGNITPSRALLANESANDADWLGGLVSLLVWETAGEWGVSLYPVALLLVCLAILHQSNQRHAEEVVVIFGCLLSLLSFEWMQPVPQSLELVLMMGLFRLLPRPRSDAPVNNVPLFLLLLTWVNIGAHVLVAYVLTGIFLLARSSSQKEKLISVLLATAGVCLTPRGIFTLWDSLHVVVPSLFSLTGNTLLIPGNPFETHAHTLPQLLFLVLAVAAVVLGLSRRLSTSDYVACLLLISVSVANVELIGISAAWIGLTICSSCYAPRGQQAAKTRSAIVVASLACLFVFHTANKTPFGVLGLNPTLDQRLLQDGLPEEIAAEVAWCDSTLAGGMYCYLAGAGRCWDIPIRAQIRGRSRENELFRRDLLRNRESRYRRPDGTWGGWWITAESRGIEILLIDADDSKLHQALQLTEWKPTDLDASVIPYVKASNVAHQPALIRCLEMQDIVSYSDWSFDFQQFAASQPYTAFFAGAGERLAKAAAMRQAQLFNSIGLQVASLKVLYALRSRFSPDEFEEEVRICHQGLASREWSETGLNSSFHLWIGRGERPEIVENDKLNLFNEQFESNYLTGKLEQMLNVPAISAEENFAQALIAIETSNLPQAIRFWRTAIESSPGNSEIARLSKHWLDLYDEEAP